MAESRTAEVLRFADAGRDPTECRWEPIEFEDLRPGHLFRLREDGELLTDYVYVCIAEPVPVGPDGNWSVSSSRALLEWPPGEKVAQNCATLSLADDLRATVARRLATVKGRSVDGLLVDSVRAVVEEVLGAIVIPPPKCDVSLDGDQIIVTFVPTVWPPRDPS